MISCYEVRPVQQWRFKNDVLTMLEAIMKEALISIIRQEHMALEARIAEEMQRQIPDGMRLEAMQEEASDLQRQLERYLERYKE
jgi:hypothetical protein